MNYIVNTRIENVTNFSVGETFFAYELKGGSLFLNDELLLSQSESYSFIENNFCFYKNGQTHIIKPKRDEVEIINSIITNYNYYFPNKAIITFDGKQDGFIYSSNWSIYQLSPFKKLYDLPHRYIGSGQIYGDISFRSNFERVKLSALSLLTGEYEWETDLGGRKYLDFSEEKTAEIRHIVGVWENLLVVTMTHNEIIVVDIETGTVLWETHDLLKKQLQKDSSGKWRGYLQNCYLENGKLYELTSSIYYSIDLRTQKVEILWQDKRERDYVTVVHTTYTSDNVYFTGSYNNRFQPHILGVFNRKALQIEWVHDMNLSIDPKLGYAASLNQAPQVSEDKLYVLDSGGTLHIFEKEEVA